MIGRPLGNGSLSTSPDPIPSPIGSPSPEFLRLVPRDFARRHLIVSLGRADGAERLLVSERTSPAAAFNAGVLLGVPLSVEIGEDEGIARLIDESYIRHGPANEDDGASAEDDARPLSFDPGEVERLLHMADRDLLSTEGKGPVVRLVDAMLFEALARSASDVHVQPLADRTLVRYRVDGVLQTVHELPPRLTASVVSRIKVMGRMDIAERRVPQDGRATVTIGSRRAVDLRLSTLPTSYGERAVVRLLDAAQGPGLDDFASLGMPPYVEGPYLDRASRPSGIVLVTGPTGSGKTTTLYTTLRWLASRGGRADGGDMNIMTIEDPIEYELATAGVAISQAQVNARKGVTFATGLRHILRQDPDVIMVGEIRDADAARTAIQASLTGHLVFSTLHTNDAATAVTRLIELGVEPYLVSASLSAVLAQRLLRLTHAACGGEGCPDCFHSGYSGRTAIFELIAVDDDLRDRVSRGVSASEVRAHARARGATGLEAEGTRLVEAGRTTRLELERVVGGLS